MMVFPLARALVFLMFRFFVHKVVGKEFLPMKGPFILAVKHVGALDGYFVLAELLPFLNRHIYFFANVLPWGWFWEKVVSERWAKTLPHTAKQKSLDRANLLLRRGKIIGIFPEGLLQEQEDRQHAKTGAARLAIWNHASIVPVGIHHRVTIRGGVQALSHRRKVILNMFRNPGTYEIHIGKPFTLDAYYDTPMTRELLYEATDLIMSHLKDLTSIRTN